MTSNKKYVYFFGNGEAEGQNDQRDVLGGKGMNQPAARLRALGREVSMPGMMDTVLNLGLNDETVEGLAKATGNRRFAYDAYRR
jgi:phosphoenolpyruvate synthase/pyruvate phosphate dikinase